MNTHQVPRPAETERVQLPLRPTALGVGQLQHRLVPGARRVGCGDDSSPKEKLEIVIRLMAISSAGRKADGVREQRAPAVARIADSHRDAGAPSHPRGMESVLEKNCGVELLGAKAFKKLAKPARAAVFAVGVVNDLTIDRRVVPVELTHPGLRNHDDFGRWKALAQGLQRWNGHHRVAQPVGGADHDFFRFFNFVVSAHQVFTGTLPSPQKSASSNFSCSLSRIDMEQARIGSPHGSIPKRFIASLSVVSIASAPKARALSFNPPNSFGA